MLSSLYMGDAKLVGSEDASLCEPMFWLPNWAIDPKDPCVRCVRLPSSEMMPDQTARAERLAEEERGQAGRL